MPLFQRYKLEGIQKFLSLHVCPFCILRYCTVDDREIYSMSENQVIAYIAKELGVSPEEIPVSDFKCCTCFNILRDQFFQRQVNKLGIQNIDEDPRYTWFVNRMENSGMKDIHEFYVEVSNLTAFMVRHYAMVNYLVNEYNLPMEIIYSIWSTRDILRLQIENLMSRYLPSATINMLGNVRIRIGLVHYETYRDFLQIPGNYPDDEDLVEIKAIEEEYAKGNTDLHELEESKLMQSYWFNSSVRSQKVILKTRANTPAAVESKLQKLQYSNYPETIISPPKEVQYEPTIGLSVYRKSIYYTGNYRKLARGLSQTPWIVDGERKTEGSVEEYILAGFKKYFNAQVYKFHSAGREDVDVRMLFEGRPFVVEMEDSKRCDLTQEEYTELENCINQSTKEIQVVGLRRCSAEGFEIMKNAAEGKHKLYLAVVYTEDAITPDQLKKLEEIHDLEIKQKTPVRVLHRRSLLTRDKMIYSMKTTYVNEHHFILELEASGGTYIKEFVHGDLGRTRPNIGELLNVDCDILQLDVKGVVGVDIQ